MSKKINLRKSSVDDLCELSVRVNTAATLLNVLVRNHFEAAEQALKESSLELNEYVRNYGEIQTMLFSIGDYLFQAKTEIDRMIEPELQGESA